MSTITKEWLQQKIADMEATRDDIPFGLGEDGTNTLAALRIALASLEAEAVEWRVAFRLDGQPGSDFEKTFENQAKMNEIISLHERAGFCASITPLFTSPPVPVSMKDHQIRELVNELRDIAVEYHGTQQLRERIARTVSTAMLQGAEPVTTAYKLRDAVEIIRSSGIEIDAEKILAERDALNAPVIPDGWVMVPVEPTEDMIVNGFESEPDESFSDEKEWATYDAMSGCQQAAHRAKLFWAAMIAAAPKTEHK